MTELNHLHFHNILEIRAGDHELIISFKSGVQTIHAHIPPAILTTLVDRIEQVSDQMRETVDSLDLRLGRDEQ